MSEITAAPAEALAPGGTDAPAAPPAETKPPEAKPVDPKAELEATLKKLGGLKVKAGGKEHTIDSMDKLLRYAQRGLPVEQSLEEIAKARAEIDPIKDLFLKMREGTEDEAEAALERLLDSGKLDKVAERRLRRQFEREKSMEGLSPRERELATQLEQERAQKTRLEEQQRQLHEQRQKAAEEQQVAAIRNHMAGAVSEALKLMDLGSEKLDAIAIEFMKPVIRASLNAGMSLDPAALAEKVGPLFEQMHRYQLKTAKQKPYLSEAVQEALANADDETLLKFFGSEVGKKYRQALLKQLNGSPKPVNGAAAATATPEQGTTTGTGKWDPRRMF